MKKFPFNYSSVFLPGSIHIYHVYIRLGVWLFFFLMYGYMHITLMHTQTQFFFQRQAYNVPETQASKWQKVRGLMPFLVDGSLSVLNFRRLSMHMLLKSDLGHLPDAWNGLNKESLKICPQINQLWKHYFQKWIAFCSPCDLVPGLLICFSKLQFCFQMWINVIGTHLCCYLLFI